MYIEAKGFLRPKDRRVLRALDAQREGPRHALLLSRLHNPTVEWARKFLKGWLIGVWDSKTQTIKDIK